MAVSSATVSPEIDPLFISNMEGFFQGLGIYQNLPERSRNKDAYSDLIRGLLKVNFYATLHGGAVAAVAELVSIACARTVVAEDKELFLGELSISYLSGAAQTVALEVDGSVVRSGRNIIVIATEFKLKETGKLVYTSHATFYRMPVANL
ncbi:hypothetical protein HHK36_027775 [Tetracentron sinense]|uniref:Thioesterase domain-containing protein n=1 Tax=Tetracentron sinense TaxID=13715 RepID=A0A835D4Q5_TETSI|nr:hypothetical protein HHK36_027775 [Tetracentron sinense]